MSSSDVGETLSLRVIVNEKFVTSMIWLHGWSALDVASIQTAVIEAAGGAQESSKLSEEEITAAVLEKVNTAPVVGTGIATLAVLLSLMLTTARGVVPSADPQPIAIGLIGTALIILTDILFISPVSSATATFALMAIPMIIALYGCRIAVQRLASNELIRVVFPPLVLIIAVLGSILGGITNPTPAAALGAAGAIMLAAYRKLQDEGGSGKVIINSTLAVVVMILIGMNFDLRINTSTVSAESWAAFFLAYAAYLYAGFGLLYVCWVLYRTSVLSPVVRETAKVTSMVFTILIGSQLLNLVVISFGGEHYIQQFLKSYDSEFQVFLIVMLVLFVLDFLEIIYIVTLIVGPVIYGGTFDPKWVTIMVVVNLQTSFLTPPFGFALFYLRGVAPKVVTTRHIYRGVAPFVLFQVFGLALLWFFPSIVTLNSSLIPK